jgi:transposase-like protein
VPKKEGSCVREAAAIYQADSRRTALRVNRAWAEKWPKQRPRAVASRERDLEELLNFFAVPPAHWRKLRTIPQSGMIDRCFREVRRRTRPISSFTNPAIPQTGTDHLRRHRSPEPLLDENTLEAIYTIMLTLPRCGVP